MSTQAPFPTQSALTYTPHTSLRSQDLFIKPPAFILRYVCLLEPPHLSAGTNTHSPFSTRPITL